MFHIRRWKQALVWQDMAVLWAVQHHALAQSRSALSGFLALKIGVGGVHGHRGLGVRGYRDENAHLVAADTVAASTILGRSVRPKASGLDKRQLTEMARKGVLIPYADDSIGRQ